MPTHEQYRAEAHKIDTILQAHTPQFFALSKGQFNLPQFNAVFGELFPQYDFDPYTRIDWEKSLAKHAASCILGALLVSVIWENVDQSNQSLFISEHADWQTSHVLVQLVSAELPAQHVHFQLRSRPRRMEFCAAPTPDRSTSIYPTRLSYLVAYLRWLDFVESLNQSTNPKSSI